MSSGLLDDFIALFDGRHEAVGTEQGGCWRFKVGEGVFSHAVKEHLMFGGDKAIGIYPLVCYQQRDTDQGLAVDWRVHWGCVDFDEGDEASWVHAKNLVRVLSKVGVAGWIERSRSKGYHVWVFAERGEWVPAATVRRGLLVACQIAGAPTKEINPKAEGHEDPPSFLGNYVRLPYPGWLGMTSREQLEMDRRVVVDMDYRSHGKFGLEMFVREAHTCAGLSGLVKLAAHWKPPVRRSDIPERDGELPELDEDIVRRMGGLAYTIWKDGVLEGHDRSGTIYKLGLQLYQDGNHTFDECVAILKDADERVIGKYVGRRDADSRYEQIMEKVWGR